MRTRGPLLIFALVALALPLGIAACGSEEELDVPEGEPVELGDLSYNVAITRFLNPADVEDEVYLEGQPEPPEGKQYLGVFMRITNESDEAQQIADEMTIVDTRGNTFEPIESESPFALTLGARVGGDSSLPEPDSAAASGPIKGAMVLFLVDEASTENRPLELEIPGDGETGKVKLDI